MKKVEDMDLGSIATKNVTDIVNLAIEHDSSQDMMVIYDTESGLSEILFEAYNASFSGAVFINFRDTGKENVLASLAQMKEKDLVVLIQSTDFRLDEFRIRLHLFERGIKVVDHMHLSRNTEESYETYLSALAYDPEWYRGVGHRLKDILAETSTLQIKSGNQELIVVNGLENPKPNLGDYREMKNVGGTFPIGEVFTEAKNFVDMNGSLMIYAFADVNFNIAFHEPFRIDIEKGLVVGWGENTPQDFIDVVEKIRRTERSLVREIGFGLNRAISRENFLKDITAFERNLGMHVSLGEKHTVYKKEGITSKKTRYHVDVFLNVDSVLSDGKEIFRRGEYIV